MFGVEDTKVKPDVSGVDTEAVAHQQTKKEARAARLEAGGNPHEWKNMNKAQKAALIMGAIGTAFTGYANPELAFAQQKDLFGRREEFNRREEAKEQIGLERAHEITKIEATTAGQIEVQNLAGDQATERQGAEFAHDRSVLDRQLEATATAQQNELNFRGDQAILDFGFKRKEAEKDRKHDTALQGSALAGQRSLALLQETFTLQEEMRGMLHAQFGTEGMAYAEEILSQVERYNATGEFGPWSEEAVDQMEIAAKTRALKLRQEEETARLAIYTSAKDLMAIASPGGQTIMDPNGPEMQRIVSVVGGLNSLVAPAEASVAIAALKTSPEGQAHLDNFVQLSGRTELPSGAEVNILAANANSLPVPINPLVSREMFFSVGANLSDVENAAPLPDGAAALDFSEADPEASREKRLYWEPVGAALEQADIRDPEFGRTLRIWHEKHQTGSKDSDYAMIWRMIKNWDGFDSTFRATLMDQLAGGRVQTGSTGQLGMPRTARR